MRVGFDGAGIPGSGGPNDVQSPRTRLITKYILNAVFVRVLIYSVNC